MEVNINMINHEVEVEKAKIPLMLISIAIGTFMSALDCNIINVVLPKIQTYFHVNLPTVEWITTAYLLIISSMTLTFGRISDLHGHKKIYMTGFILFTAGSLFCGLSYSIQLLIGCRILQALGAGMMFSSNFAIITSNVLPENRGKAFSVMAIAVAVGACVGPAIGGELASLFSWRSIFFINIPFGIIGIFLAMKSIPCDVKRTHLPLDISGSIFIFMALLLILIPFELVGIKQQLFFIFLLLGAIFIVIFIVTEIKSKYPLLNLTMFHSRILTANLIAAFFNYMSQCILAFIAPFYLEQIRMLSTATTGLLYISMPISMIVASPISGIFSDKHDSRIFSSMGMGIMAIGMTMISFASINTPYWYIVASMLLVGSGSGMFQTPNNNTIMSSAPKNHRGTVSAVLATFRNIGMVMGVAVSGAIFNFSSGKAQAFFASKGMTGLALKQSAFIKGMQFTILAAVITALLSMLFSLLQGEKTY